MRPYHRLTQEERYTISILKESHFSFRQIALKLNRSVSTISREIHRNKETKYKYNPKKAHRRALKRRKHIGPPLKITEEFCEDIKQRLREKWSPEQISGRFKREKGINISHETIYQYVFKDYKEGGELYKHLRRRRRGGRRSWKVSRSLRKAGRSRYNHWIDKRPVIVDRRVRLGDYERDTMLGQRNGPVLLTIVDRKTRLTRIGKVERVNSCLTHEATVCLLRGRVVRTITNDNGPEFACHEETSRVLKAKVYFNHPYSSWQRGTNENTNGLIRQYYPKGTDFRKVSEEEIKKVEEVLNNRPRKCLAYKTPFEVHRE